MPLDYQRFIERNPWVCGGEPVIKGTRVTVRTIFASLAEAPQSRSDFTKVAVGFNPRTRVSQTATSRSDG